ncbi:UDP-glucose--hexose-1-phosphate uridylyltransferase [Vagococcus sp. PNs007]|uniref:Galactose-1-phosphate uridylyltransferase n=1 Tax=Vagococcus proximus TaxID=2991417 RepID=A0ABT5X0S6_9ENTE|nr:UDP-glucose--hexose-1-phosphate uridylyltransferase [Vagococcus proximus]MDF0479509.1 UDP-glucose--hexose-1-phosphate uridylyltransferase [Vagococcus proximus]
MQLIIDQFVSALLEYGEFEEIDRAYLTNKVLGILGRDEYPEAQEINKEVPTWTGDLTEFLVLLDRLAEDAVSRDVIPDSQNMKDRLTGQLVDIMTLSPSAINKKFWSMYEDSPRKATDFFYKWSQLTNYIKTREVAKSPNFLYESPYGPLEITINLSKPEKTTAEIIAEKSAPKVNYPNNFLCVENEGYLGRENYPARSQHRLIRFPLGEQEWALQYSPYAYYNEHCIFLNTSIVPMSVSKESFKRLVEIVSVFPDYFVGSNADLPIVGGSILSHDHYQAGRHTFAMETAPVRESFELIGFPKVEAGIVDWPMSVIRLVSEDKKQLVEAADKVFRSWKEYSDEKVDIIAYTGNTRHHTVTPIARKMNGNYCLDIVLRDNHTSDEHPEGVFHPHRKWHHIKQENIGLIEVMGLAVLPARLAKELAEVEGYLLNQSHDIAQYHREWAEEIKEKHQVTLENCHEIVQNEVGKVFLEVLKDAGVYKDTNEGQEAFRRFVAQL